MTKRCIGNEVFKKIVEMANEMALADKIDLWCIDRVEVAQAVASRCQEVSIPVRKRHDMKIERDSSKKQRLLVLYKEIDTGLYEMRHWADGDVSNIKKTIQQAYIIGTYNYSEKKDLYDSICDYLLEYEKTTHTYEERKKRATDLLEYHKTVNSFASKDDKEEQQYLLQKIYNTVM